MLAIQIKDVKTFETINKKATMAIHSLKVNPWFKDREDIFTFYSIFNQPTINLISQFYDLTRFSEVQMQSLEKCDQACQKTL